MARLKAKQYDEAITLFNKVIDKVPRATAPYINLAIAYKAMGKLDMAEKQLQKVLKLVPDHPVACNEYGQIYRKTGRFTIARAVYEKALKKYPNYYPVHKNLGILCDLYLNDLPCALEHYQVYSKAMPKDEQVKLWIVDLKGRMGQN